MKEIGYALLAVLLLAGCGLDSGEEKAPAAEDIPAAQEIKVHEIPAISETLYHKAAQAYGKGHRTEALRLANQAINEDGESGHPWRTGCRFRGLCAGSLCFPP